MLPWTSPACGTRHRPSSSQGPPPPYRSHLHMAFQPPPRDYQDCKEDRCGDSQCPGVTAHSGALPTSWRFRGQGRLACLPVPLSISLLLTVHSFISGSLVSLSFCFYVRCWSLLPQSPSSFLLSPPSCFCLLIPRPAFPLPQAAPLPGRVPDAICCAQSRMRVGDGRRAE